MFESTDYPINLIYAKSPEYSATSAYYIEGYILLHKLGFTKNVSIHYTYDCKSWLVVNASFLTDNKSNHEIWHFKTPNSNDYSSCSFAICYKVDGNEYWDNNHNINYSLKWYSPTKLLKNCVVFLDKTFRTSSIFYGNIIIKNIAYHKQVKVRYSYNDWKTISEVDAVYTSQISNSLENWTFSIALTVDSKVKFILYYIANDITYIDNNFEMDYSI